PAEIEKTFSASVIIRDVEGHEERLVGVTFRFVRGGTEEIELSNGGQDVPWVFGMTLNRVNKRANLTFNIHGGTGSAKREAEAGHFQDCLANGGTLSVVGEETGLPLLSIDVPAD